MRCLQSIAVIGDKQGSLYIPFRIREGHLDNIYVLNIVDGNKTFKLHKNAILEALILKCFLGKDISDLCKLEFIRAEGIVPYSYIQIYDSEMTVMGK